MACEQGRIFGATAEQNLRDGAGEDSIEAVKQARVTITLREGGGQRPQNWPGRMLPAPTQLVPNRLIYRYDWSAADLGLSYIPFHNFNFTPHQIVRAADGAVLLFDIKASRMRNEPSLTDLKSMLGDHARAAL